MLEPKAFEFGHFDGGCHGNEAVVREDKIIFVISSVFCIQRCIELDAISSTVDFSILSGTRPWGSTGENAHFHSLNGSTKHNTWLDAECGEDYKTIISSPDNPFVAIVTAVKVANFGSLRFRQYSSNMHQSWHAYSDNAPLPKCETLFSKMFIWKKIWALKEGQVGKEQKNRFFPAHFS